MAKRTLPTPLKAIHKHCYTCCGQNWKEVPKCPATTCNLYPFRMGKDPEREGKGRPGGNPGLNRRK